MQAKDCSIRKVKANPVIYEAMQRLHEDRAPIDPVTVAEQLKDNKAWKPSGGLSYLAELANNVPTASHAQKYAEIVRDHSLRRRLLKAGESIQQMANTDNNQQRNYSKPPSSNCFSYRSSPPKPNRVNLPRSHPTVTNSIPLSMHSEDPAEHFGIRTGFPDIDQLVTGLQPGHLIGVGCRPSVGKAQLWALDIALNVAVEGRARDHLLAGNDAGGIL